VRKIDHIVVHHSASPLSTTFEDVDRWHRAKGWAGCGYHFVIEGNGKLVRGRELSRIGAHVKGQNTHALGILVTGDNTIIRSKWRAVQIIQLATLTDVLEVMFPGAVTKGHRDMPGVNTACPGLNIKELLK
jgi:N-acetylmuramoyl-L-alanine amidase